MTAPVEDAPTGSAEIEVARFLVDVEVRRLRLLKRLRGTLVDVMDGLPAGRLVEHPDVESDYAIHRVEKVPAELALLFRTGLVHHEMPWSSGPGRDT